MQRIWWKREGERERMCVCVCTGGGGGGEWGGVSDKPLAGQTGAWDGLHFTQSLLVYSWECLNWMSTQELSVHYVTLNYNEHTHTTYIMYEQAAITSGDSA